MRFLFLLFTMVGLNAQAQTPQSLQEKAQGALQLFTDGGKLLKFCTFKSTATLIVPSTDPIKSFFAGSDVVTVEREGLMVEYENYGYSSTLVYLVHQIPNEPSAQANFYIYEDNDIRKVKRDLSELMTRIAVNNITLGECFDASGN